MAFIRPSLKFRSAFFSPLPRISQQPMRFVSSRASTTAFTAHASPIARSYTRLWATRWAGLRSGGRSRVRWNSNGPSPNPTPNLGSPPSTLTLSQRLKALGKEYGWTALGVYFALSALDFPFCFLAVRLLGAERVGRWEQAAVDSIRNVVQKIFPDLMQKKEAVVVSEESEAEEVTANANSDGTASLWTQLVLAYAVHKSLIFLRVPLTAAVLPKVVKTLRKWGYKVGNKPAVPKSSV